ncbi:MAG TPA: hypothetical protein VKT78_09370 [Fimbriimonadaceae bacterium]|nr:hypothetical protein [Fimbriimonadaceae bacterium]
MTTIRSTWTRPTPPPLTGLLPVAEWSGTAAMAIPRGTLMAQNDATHLYVGLDLTAETGAANPNDYFWFVVDLNDNGVIDANRDKLFSDWPGSPNRLGMWLMAGPDETWPASNTQVIPSQVREGFGPSMNSATPHRQWQLAFALSDLNITIDPTAPAPVVRFGIRIATDPGFIAENPPNPLGDFSNLNEIILAVVPSATVGSLGPVIGSVGLIGTGLIGADGYCNIPPATPYYFHPQEAAFSGTLNLIGNVATLTALWAAGARKYKVLHRFGDTAAHVAAQPWTPILQSWANYEIVGPNDVWQSFGPDGSGFYPMVDPALPYTIQNLVFQWTSAGEPDDLHQFEFQFFQANGAAVASPAQVLTLKLDNQPAIVELINVLHAGAPVSPCAIVNLSSISDGVQIAYEAFDPEGDLYSYTLEADYGHGNRVAVYSDNYTAHANPAHNWQGVTSDTRPVPPAVWVPPATCAYMFQISAWTRTTNGYQFPVIETTDFQTVTLIKPGFVLKPVPLVEKKLMSAGGFEAPPKVLDAARKPIKVLAAKS